MNPTSLKLADRVLWFDGDSSVSAVNIEDMILSGVPTAGLYTDEITPEIEQFNRFCSMDDRIGIKQEIRPLPYDWSIPDQYKTIDVTQHLYAKIPSASDDDTLIRIARVQHELQIYEQLELLPILRVLIYIINTLENDNVLWGVGRGSSVASYVLYLIGVHDIDSVKYQLDITDFLRI